MPRPRDAALRAGLYVAVALSGFATAYVLREWLPRLWEARALPDSPDDKTDPAAPAPPTDDVPTPVTDADARTPSKSLPPLRTYALPPPPPTLLSGSYLSVNADTIPPPTSAGSFHTSSSVEDEGASQTNTTSDPLGESFADLLSPAPAHVISRRRSMRSHDLFAASHISFAELGSLVAPQDEPK